MAPPIIIAIVTLFVGLGLWLHFYIQRIQRHQLQTLAETPCGTPYGADVAERARQEYLAQCHEAQKQHPKARINFVRYWEIRCPQCVAEARFHYETESLVADAAA